MNMRQAANDIGTKAKRIDNNVSRAFQNSARNIAIIDGPLGGVASRLSAVATQVKSIGLVMGASLLAIGGTGFALSRAATEGEKFNRSARKTEALLRTTSRASGQTSQSIRDMSREIALATLASVDGTEAAVQKLLTFKSISGDAFRRTLELSQDLAELGFGNIETAAVQLGKALEDPAIGLSSLRRIGVSFSQQQQEVIKKLAETNRLAEAQELILDALSDQVSGTAVAAAKELSGAQDALNQRMSEFWQALDKRTQAGATLTNFYDALAKKVQTVTEILDPESMEISKRIVLQAQEVNRLRAVLERKIDGGALKGSIEKTQRELAAAVELEEQLKDLALSRIKEKEAAEETANIRRKEVQWEENLAKMKKLVAETLKKEGDEQAKAAEKVQQFTDNLENQVRSLGIRNDALLRNGQSQAEAIIQMETYVAVLQAGVAAHSAEAKEIEKLVRQRHELAVAYDAEIGLRADAEKASLDAAAEAEAWGNQVSDSLARAIVQGDSLLGTLKRLTLQLAEQKLANFLFGALFGTSGKMDFFGGLLGGARANGGPVAAGTSYLVGERGPELFTPNTGGQISSNDRLVSGGGETSIYIDARGSTDPAATEAAVDRALAALAPALMGGTQRMVFDALTHPKVAL